MLIKKLLFISFLFISSLASADSLFENTMDRFLEAHNVEDFTTEGVMSYQSMLSNHTPPFNDDFLSLTCDVSYEERMALGERLMAFAKSIDLNAYFSSAPSQAAATAVLVEQMKTIMTIKFSTFRSLHQHCKGNPGDFTIINLF